MKIYLKGHDYKYEVSEFLKLFSSEFSFVEDLEEFSSFKGVLIENTLTLSLEGIHNSYDDLNKSTFKNIDIKNEDISTSKNADIENEYISKNSEQKDETISMDIGIEDMNNFNKNDSSNTYVVKSQTVVYENEKKVYEKTVSECNITEKKLKTVSKRLIQVSMFDFLNKKFDVNVPWGILTGIRPVKLIHSLLDEGKNEEDIRIFMKDSYLISDEKMDLILDIAKRERKFIYPLSKDKISLYISVPFCPTRCLYCSFPSHPLKRFKDLRDEYVEKVLEEARGLDGIIKMQGKEIETLYIGGGTPTALEDYQLEKLIDGVFSIFDLSKMKEFTVEAGRPDSITREKLQVLKNKKVDRISINPQTFKDETLEFVGRNHKSEDIVSCFNMARELGFENINMDIILGLPKETPEDVEATMKKIIELNPESVTVHTLALKRASDLNINMEEYKKELTGYQSMIKMIEISRMYMEKYGYNPYYMYRQKHMLGNLENIGYAKEGYECLYNMQIMEEKQSNYAIGAGAVSKFVYLGENRIERVDDVKNLEIYLQRVDEMIDKKYREVEKNDKSSKRN